jgi:hypothetical protein
MKKLLSLLMCFVFLQAESFALRGGPNQGAGRPVLGAYTGVILATDGTTDIGMFLVSVVSNGASVGEVVFFSENAQLFDFYIGALTGVSDPDKGIFYGVFNGRGAGSSTFTAKSLSGQVRFESAKVNAVANSSRQRITGTATSRTNEVITVPGTPPVVRVVVGPVRSYMIDGWQSSLTDTPVPFSSASSGFSGNN